VNPGMAIFRRHQRFQRGAGDVRYTPVTPTEEYPYSTDYEFIHRKVPDVQGDFTPEELAQLTPEESAQEQRDWDIVKQQNAAIPTLTPEERREVLELNPKDWSDSTREKVGQANEMAGKAMQLKRGTANVNPGLLLFRKQMLRKPKL
jgi:hypothetical protein